MTTIFGNKDMQVSYDLDKGSQNLFFWLVIVYIFLEVVGAADVYSFLNTIRVQRLLMGVILASALFQSGLKLRFGWIGLLIILFNISILISSFISPYQSLSLDVVYDYSKIVILYFVIIYCVKNDISLKTIIVCFTLIAFLYIILSLREFLLGQHVSDMGVRRMLGWDSQTGPNRFGLFCVVFLPFAFFLLKKNNRFPIYFGRLRLLSEGMLRKLMFLYVPLALGCVFLTRSRSALVVLLLFLFLTFVRSRHKFLIALLLLVLSVVVWSSLPDVAKERYMSILYEVGIVERKAEMSSEEMWAHTSAQGRMDGLVNGLKLFYENPFFGVGPGNYQYVSGSNLQTHNLIGQVLSETGIAGLVPFVLLIVSIFLNNRRCKQLSAVGESVTERLLYARDLGNTINTSLLLLMFGSMFAHTLFFSWWLFLAAFSFLNLKIAEEFLEAKAV
ncbi:MAG: O-antigen ligase family protein [Thermodesulfobacteriota bacterium]